MAETIKLTVGASVRALSTERGFDPSGLRRKAEASGIDPSIFDEREPFFWRVQMSNNRLDFYRSRMANPTLDRFAKNAKAGIQFLGSHDSSNLGVGRSLDGQVVSSDEQLDDAPGEQIPERRMLADFYTVRGLKLSPDMGTDDFVDGVRAGIIKDVSVGFFCTDVTCSVCGGQMYQGYFGGFYGRECAHVPGMTYTVTDASGKPKTGPGGTALERLCYAWINDGEAVECSAVYDGATPHAAVEKAALLAQEGGLDDRTITAVERMYRCTLPVQHRPGLLVPGLGPAVAGRGGSMGTRTPPTDTPETPVAEVVADPIPAPDPPVPATEEVPEGVVFQLDGAEPATTEERAPVPTDIAARLTALRTEFAGRGITIGTDPVVVIRDLAGKVLEQHRDASDGRAYRAQQIDDAITEGVRATPQGSTFDDALYRGMFAKLEIREIAAFAAQWRTAADAVFRNGPVTHAEEPPGAGEDPADRQLARDAERGAFR